MDETLQRAYLHLIIFVYHTQTKVGPPKGITIFQNLLKWCVLKIFRQFCCSCDEVSRVVLGIAWKSNVDTAYAMCIVVWWLLSIWTPDHTGSHGPWLYSSAMWSGIRSTPSLMRLFWCYFALGGYIHFVLHRSKWPQVHRAFIPDM